MHRGVERKRTNALPEEPAETRLLPHDVVATATSHLPALIPFVDIYVLSFMMIYRGRAVNLPGFQDGFMVLRAPLEKPNDYKSSLRSPFSTCWVKKAYSVPQLQQQRAL